MVGIADMLAGLLKFLSPGMMALMLWMFIAGWTMAIGVLQIWGAIQLRNEIQNELLVLSGVLAIAFGLYMTIRPAEGAGAVVWTIGSFAILVGCIYVGLAFQLKKHKSSTWPAGDLHRGA